MPNGIREQCISEADLNHAEKQQAAYVFDSCRQHNTMEIVNGIDQHSGKQKKIPVRHRLPSSAVIVPFETYNKNKSCKRNAARQGERVTEKISCFHSAEKKK